MRLEPHLLLEGRHVVGVPIVPDRQGGSPAVADGVRVRVVAPEFLLRGLLVIVREVAEKQEREHVVAEIVRVHRPPELIGDGPERAAELLLIVFCHVASLVSDGRLILKQIWIEGVTVDEIVENLPEVPLVFLQHLPRLE